MRRRRLDATRNIRPKINNAEATPGKIGAKSVPVAASFNPDAGVVDAGVVDAGAAADGVTGAGDSTVGAK